MRPVAMLGALALGAALLAAPVAAQGISPTMPVVTLDQDRLFSESRYGQAVQKALENEVQALASENRRIEGELEAEERALTARRAGLSADEFRKLADAFDAKAEDTRKTQDAKARALARRRDDLRKTFFERAKPVLGQLMAERGAVAVIDKSAIILAFDRIDMTDDAIARLDRVMGDGSGPRIQLMPQAADPSSP
ncbi:MAG: OmpH family outer membrane protein [Paracoccaceae bacterium]